MSTSLSDQNTPVADLKKLVGQFIEERQWSGYNSPKNVAISIVLEAAELLEHFQWWHPKPGEIDEQQKIAIGEEMADVLAYLLSLSIVMDVDLASTLQKKMEKNKMKYPSAKFQGNWEKVEL